MRPRTQETVAVSADGVLLVPAERLAQSARRMQDSAPHPARAAPFADRGAHPDERRPRPLSGPVVVAGVSPADRLRDGERARRFHRGNVLYKTLERFEGQVTWRALSVNPGRAQPLGNSGLTVTAISTPGKLPLHLETVSTPSAGDNIGLVIHNPRTGGRLAYFSGVGSAGAGNRAGAGRCGGAVLRRDVLVERRADCRGSRYAARRRHGALAGGGAEGSAAFLARQRGRKS